MSRLTGMHDQAFEELHVTGVPVSLLPSRIAMTFFDPGREAVDRVVVMLEALADKLRVTDPSALPIGDLADLTKQACVLANLHQNDALDPLPRYRLVIRHEKDGVAQSAELLVDSPARQAAAVMDAAGGSLNQILNALWGQHGLTVKSDWAARLDLPLEPLFEHEVALAAAGLKAVFDYGDGWKLVDEQGSLVVGQPRQGYPLRHQCVSAWFHEMGGHAVRKQPEADGQSSGLSM